MRESTAALPDAAFPGPKGRKRIGHSVEYYRETGAPGARWALPDRIALSKLQDYAWQDEFRLVFSLTDALDFEKVSVNVVPEPHEPPADPAEHRDVLVKAASLSDICRIHEHRPGS